MDLDLAQVRAFVVAADLGNLTRAAAELHLTQQAVSKRLTRLEATVGVLFERVPAGMVLTDRGRTFLPAARDLLAASEAAVATARETPPPTLRVDVWGEHHPVAALVTAFASSRPELVVEYSMRRSLPQALIALQRRELDVAVGNVAGLAGALDPGLATELVTCTPVAALVNERNPLSDRAELERDELRQARLWWPVVGSSPELARFVEEYAAWLDAPLDLTGRNTADRQALVEAVRADPTTITFIDAHWPASPREGVRAIRIRPTPCYPWSAIWPVVAAHPVVPALVGYLRRSGHIPDPRSEDVWLPERTRSRAR